MPNRARTSNLLLSLAAYLIFMVALLTAIGGVGTVELLIWLVILVVGTALIFRLYRRARSCTADVAG